MTTKAPQEAFKQAVSRINRAGLTVEDVSVISDNFLEALELIGSSGAIDTIKSVSKLAIETRSLAVLEALMRGAQSDTSNYGKPTMSRLTPIIEARLELLKIMREMSPVTLEPKLLNTPRIAKDRLPVTPAKGGEGP